MLRTLVILPKPKLSAAFQNTRSFSKAPFNGAFLLSIPRGDLVSDFKKYACLAVLLILFPAPTWADNDMRNGINQPIVTQTENRSLLAMISDIVRTGNLQDPTYIRDLLQAPFSPSSQKNISLPIYPNVALNQWGAFAVINVNTDFYEILHTVITRNNDKAVMQAYIDIHAQGKNNECIKLADLEALYGVPFKVVPMPQSATAQYLNSTQYEYTRRENNRTITLDVWPPGPTQCISGWRIAMTPFPSANSGATGALN